MVKNQVSVIGDLTCRLGPHYTPHIFTHDSGPIQWARGNCAQQEWRPSPQNIFTAVNENLILLFWTNRRKSSDAGTDTGESVHCFRFLHIVCQRILKPKCVFAENKVKRGGQGMVEIKHAQTLFAGPRCLFKFLCYKKTVLSPSVQCSRLENERDRVQHAHTRIVLGLRDFHKCQSVVDRQLPPSIFSTTGNEEIQNVIIPRRQAPGFSRSASTTSTPTRAALLVRASRSSWTQNQVR